MPKDILGHKAYSISDYLDMPNTPQPYIVEYVPDAERDYKKTKFLKGLLSGCTAHRREHQDRGDLTHELDVHETINNEFSFPPFQDNREVERTLKVDFTQVDNNCGFHTGERNGKDHHPDPAPESLSCGFSGDFDFFPVPFCHHA